MESLTRSIRLITMSLCLVAALCLAIMMFLTSSDVVLRYLGHPIKGSYDIVGLLGAITVALAVGYSQLNDRQVATEFIVFIKSKLMQAVIRTGACLLSVGMFAILAWQCTLLGTHMYTVGRVSDTMQVPIFPFVYILALGFAVNCVVLLIDLIRRIIALNHSADVTTKLEDGVK